MKEGTIDTKETVIAYFHGKIKFLGVAEASQLACNYLETGVLDSMGVVEMIVEFENSFKICFSPEDMLSPDFQTVGGLVTLINRLREKQPQ
jgi:acyl carrier protein